MSGFGINSGPARGDTTSLEATNGCGRSRSTILGEGANNMFLSICFYVAFPFCMPNTHFTFFHFEFKLTCKFAFKCSLTFKLTFKFAFMFFLF